MEIRDRRTGRWFWMHAAVLDDYGPALGVAGLAVYTALCRRANPQERAWPSIRSMAKALGCGKSTVTGALERLEGLGLIKIEKRQSEAGDASSNVYTLLDPSQATCPDTGTRCSATGTEVETEKKGSSSSSSSKKTQKNTYTPAELDSAQGLVDLVNTLAGSHYRHHPGSEAVRTIVGRLREGYDDFLLAEMVRTKYREWAARPEMLTYFRPSTLFRPSKCEEYVGALTDLQRAKAARERAKWEASHAQAI